MATQDMTTGSVSSKSVTSSDGMPYNAPNDIVDENILAWIKAANKKDDRAQPWREEYIVKEVPDFSKQEEMVDFGQCGVVASGSETLAA